MRTNPKAQFSSPFTNPHGMAADPKSDADDLYERNPCPYFAHPHDMGPDTIPLVFEEGVLGKRYHGADIEAEGAKLSSAFGRKK